MKYIEEKIKIDNKPFNRLQVYKVDINFRANKNEMKKSRPHVLIQASEIGGFYGNTKFICVPLTSQNNEMIKINDNFIVALDNNSNALVFNSTMKTEMEIKTWYNKDTNQPVTISREEYIEILSKMEEYNMTMLSFTEYAMKHQNRYQQLFDSIEGLRADNQELKAGNQELKAGNQELKADNQELKAGNQELKADNQELKEKLNQLIQAYEQKEDNKIEDIKNPVLKI